MFTKRLHDADMLRGHFLIAMIVDHLIAILGPSFFIFYNGGGKLWLSAAEGFVFLAGFMVGYLYVYYRERSMREVSIKFLQKFFLLYALSVSLTIIVSLLFPTQQLLQTGVLVGKSVSFFDLVLNSLLFLHHVGWVNILTVYTCLFAATPLLVWLARKSPLLLATLSFLLWLATNMKLVSFTAFGFLDIFAWQIIFVAGIIAGNYREKIKSMLDKIIGNPILSIIVLLAFLGIIYGSLILPNFTIANYQMFQKVSCCAGRLLLLPIGLVGCWLVLRLVLDRLPASVMQLYRQFGRNSLFVYGLHAAVLPFVAVYGIGSNSALMTIAVLLLIESIVKLVGK